MTKTLSIVGNIKRLDGTTEILTDPLNVSEDYTESTDQEITIAAGATDVAINLAGITTAQLAILVPTFLSSAEGYLTVKVNGGTEAIPFGKIGAFGGSGSNGITALSITNPDASNPVQLKVYLS